jgi:hypothetical protein
MHVVSYPNNCSVLTLVVRLQFSTCYYVTSHVINGMLRVGEHPLHYRVFGSSYGQVMSYGLVKVH